MVSNKINKRESTLRFWLILATLITITGLKFFTPAAFSNVNGESQIELLQKEINRLKNSSNNPADGITEEEYNILALQKDIALLKNEQFSSQTNFYLTVFQIISGLAVFGGFYFTWKSQKYSNEKAKIDFEITERRLINERYEKAMENLGSDKSAVRLGGMYALSGIAKENPEQYRDESINILAVFVQDQCSSRICKDKDLSKGISSVSSIDVQKCLVIIAELSMLKTVPKKNELKEINLRNTHLSDFQFKFQKIDLMLDLSSSNLEDIDFWATKFLKARFKNSTLKEINFKGATLDMASFKGSNIKEKTCFENAKLKKVKFEETEIQNSTFRGACLAEASFKNAKLDGVTFENANLAGASFENAKLERVTFRNADLNKTNFENVDLRNTDINEEQLGEALLCNTILPNGVVSNRDSKK